MAGEVFIKSYDAIQALSQYYQGLEYNYNLSLLKNLIAENPAALSSIYGEMGLTAIPSATTSLYSVSTATAIGESSLTVPSSYGLSVLQASADVATDTLTMSQMPALETASGVQLAEGAGVFFSEVVPVLGAVAVGTGLGIAEYKAHPRFWTDLSNAIFGGGNGEQNAFEIITRAFADGGIGSYMRAEDAARITKALNDMGAYPTTKVESTIPKDTPDGTVVDFTWSEVSPIGLASSIALQKFREAGYSNPIYSVQENRYTNPYTGKVGTWGSAESILNPPTSGDIGRYTGEDIYVTGFNISYIGYSVVVYDDGELQYVGYHEGHQSFCSGEYISDEAPLYVHRIHGLNVDITTEGGREEAPVNGTTPNLSPNAAIDGVLAGLKAAFPDWFNDGFALPRIDPITGDIVDDWFIPVRLPQIDPTELPIPNEGYTQLQIPDGIIDPISTEQTDALTVPLPVMALPNLIKIDIPSILPIVPSSTTGSNKLFTVYNPILSEISQLGGYLWSDNILDIISKFFQNPMDAIISLHVIYATPAVSGTPHQIMLGNLPSGVSSKVVSNQYITIDCGTKAIKEYFNDYRDYTTHTSIEAFLPFIGFVPLKTTDVVGSNISIRFSIDVLTGVVLAEIVVNKQGTSKVLYTYSGNCSTQIPLTGSDRTRIISGAMSGFAGGMAVGGVVGGAIGAAVGGFTGGTTINRSGGFSGNAGAMGVKTPYIIISRKIQYDSANLAALNGLPSNTTVRLGNCKGYTKIKYVHLENIPCTDNERIMIENALTKGVIF